MSIISELNDNCFAITTEFFIDLCKEVEDEVGRKPTLNELCELLTWGLRGANTEILSDVDVDNVESIIAKCRKRTSKRLTAGDLVAVPAENGMWYLGVYITSNTFGCAYGFFSGTWPLRPLEMKDDPTPLLPVIYSCKHAIQQGIWKVIGNYPTFLDFFPVEPEIYHYKKDHPDDASIGPFGSAESPDGQLREIDKQEAKTVGLLDGSYKSTRLEDVVPGYLHELNRRFNSGGME